MQYSNTVQTNLSNIGTGFVSVYKPPEFIDLLAKTQVENDFAKRELLYEQLNKIAIDDYCLVVPIMGLQILTAKTPKLHDCGYGDKVAVEYLPERAWIEQ
jgi:ABC-type transport system substrate-binding protein